MAADDFTILNPGVGGSVMDESRIVYPTEPTVRRRPRVVISGEGIGELVPVVTSAPTGSEYGVITRSIIEYPGDSITIFDTATLVPASTETTIISYTVPADKTFHFVGFVVSGNANALFKLYLDTDPIMASRSSVANLTVNVNYTMPPFKVTEGVTVRIKVTHQASVSCDFEGTLLGYNV